MYWYLKRNRFQSTVVGGGGIKPWRNFFHTFRIQNGPFFIKFPFNSDWIVHGLQVVSTQRILSWEKEINHLTLKSVFAVQNRAQIILPFFFFALEFLSDLEISFLWNFCEIRWGWELIMLFVWGVGIYNSEQFANNLLLVNTSLCYL